MGVVVVLKCDAPVGLQLQQESRLLVLPVLLLGVAQGTGEAVRHTEVAPPGSSGVPKGCLPLETGTPPLLVLRGRELQ